MIKLIKQMLQQFINDIDSGNSNIDEAQQSEIIELLQRINQKEMSATEASQYIGVCRTTFNNYIDRGLIPKGKKRMGFKELSWSKYDLDKFLKKNG